MENIVDDKTRDILRSDGFADYLGIKLLDVGPGKARVSLQLDKRHLNFHGMVHGGVIFSLADVAFAAASNSFGSKAVALSVNIDFLSAADTSDELTAEVEQLSRAGKMGYYSMKVLDSSGTTIALCRGWAYHTGKPFHKE